MGIKPKLKNRQKKTSLRSVVYMVVAGLRMKKMQVEWSVNKKLRATLAKKLQQVRRNREEALVTE